MSATKRKQLKRAVILLIIAVISLWIPERLSVSLAFIAGMNEIIRFVIVLGGDV